MGLIAKGLGWLLCQLYLLLQNYGLTLVIFTVLFKLCLYPLYKKQIMSTIAMSSVSPKMKEIQTKYANDKEIMNEKMMELYKEEGFNPMSGCLPMVIQLPIIYGLFALLRNPLLYITDNEMIFAVHEAFLWIHDLSQPDLWILPIAAGITTFISFSQTQSQQADNQAAAQTASMMRVMKYFFPLTIVWMGRSFPAGLTIYWFIGTLVQILFNLHFNRLRKEANAAKELRKMKKK